MDNTIIEVNESTFVTDVIERSKRQPVIVDFWAPWCGPCRMLSPILEKVTKEANGAFVLAKINSDNNQRLAAQYGVQGIPAVKMFRDGKVVGEFVGALPEPRVREFIKQHAPAGGDLALTAAQSLFDEGRLPEAEVTVRNVLAQQPDHVEANLMLAKMLLGTGRGVEASEALSRIPTDTKEAVIAEKLQPLARLMAVPATTSDGLDGLFATAADLARQGRYQEVMDTLLNILRKNKTYRDGEAKNVLLACFELLRPGTLVNEYRRKLANVLF